MTRTILDGPAEPSEAERTRWLALAIEDQRVAIAAQEGRLELMRLELEADEKRLRRMLGGG